MLRRLFQRRVQKAFLFSYWDGKRMRHQDGERLWRRYMLNTTLTDPLFLQDVEAGKPGAVERFFSEVAQFFDVQRYDDRTGGLTDEELARVYLAFLAWVEQKKKRDGSWRTWSPTAETESSPSGQPGPTKSSG